MDELRHLPELEYKEKMVLFVVRMLLRDDLEILAQLDKALRKEQ